MTNLLAVALMGVAGVSAAEKFDADPKHQLPRPDGKPADMKKPVKVFILMGQSNMAGCGKLEPGDNTPEPGVLAIPTKCEGGFAWKPAAHPLHNRQPGN